MKSRARRRPSTRSASQRAAATMAASTANSSGTPRCRPSPTCSATVPDPPTSPPPRAQLMPLSAATPNHAAAWAGRSAKSSSNRACAKIQNSTALATDTATSGACHGRGTSASNSGVELTTCTHKPRHITTAARAAGRRGRSRSSTTASSNSKESNMPRRTASIRKADGDALTKGRSVRAQPAHAALGAKPSIAARGCRQAERPNARAPWLG